MTAWRMDIAAQAPMTPIEDPWIENVWLQERGTGGDASAASQLIRRCRAVTRRLRDGAGTTVADGPLVEAGNASTPPSLGHATQAVGGYVDQWLHVDPERRAWSHDVLFDRFFEVSTAFDVLAMGDPGSSWVQRVALTEPPAVPDFLGLDLWLQRRAASALHGHRGVRFLEEHLDELRPALVASVLLAQGSEMPSVLSRSIRRQPGKRTAYEAMGYRFS